MPVLGPGNSDNQTADVDKVILVRVFTAPTTNLKLGHLTGKLSAPVDLRLLRAATARIVANCSNSRPVRPALRNALRNALRSASALQCHSGGLAAL